MYRLIDFKRDKENIPATIAAVEYDPNRSALIALLYYKDGEKRYILARKESKVGATVVTSNEPPFPSRLLHETKVHAGRFCDSQRRITAWQGW